MTIYVSNCRQQLTVEVGCSKILSAGSGGYLDKDEGEREKSRRLQDDRHIQK